jgi:hypothetical protein
MITREQTDAKIAEIRDRDIPNKEQQELIDEALTIEANQLTHGNNIAIIQAAIFGMCLLGLLAVL